MQSWLLLQFIRREIENRYAGSVMGIGRALLQPVLVLLTYAFIFTAVFKVRPPQSDTPYLLFVAVALWPWLAFQEGVLRGMQAVVSNAALVKKVRFPRHYLVHAAVISTFLVHSVGYALVLTLLTLFGYRIHFTGIGFAFVLMPVLYAFTVGLALAACAVQVYVRDVEQLVGQVLSLALYLTPVLYSVQMLPDWIQTMMPFNPMTPFAESFRSAWIIGLGVSWVSLMQAVVYAAVSLGVGAWIFQRVEANFEDVL